MSGLISATDPMPATPVPASLDNAFKSLIWGRIEQPVLRARLRAPGRHGDERAHVRPCDIQSSRLGLERPSRTRLGQHGGDTRPQPSLRESSVGHEQRGRSLLPTRARRSTRERLEGTNHDIDCPRVRFVRRSCDRFRWRRLASGSAGNPSRQSACPEPEPHDRGPARRSALLDHSGVRHDRSTRQLHDHPHAASRDHSFRCDHR